MKSDADVVPATKFAELTWLQAPIHQQAHSKPACIGTSGFIPNNV